MEEWQHHTVRENVGWDVLVQLFFGNYSLPQGGIFGLMCIALIMRVIIQLTLEQQGFELGSSIYRWIFLNKYIGKFFGGVLTTVKPVY